MKQSLVASLLRWPLRLVPAETPRRILSGGSRGAWWVPASSTHGCWLGTYERRLQKVISRVVSPGQTFFDIGANVGFYTLLAARLVGDAGAVIAFEPLPRNVTFLRRHLELNRVANVRVLAMALGDVGGESHLSVGNSPSMGRLGDQGVPVAVDTLDHLVETGQVPPPDVLKIDVEGAESRVLAGSASTLQRYRPAILLAAHGWSEERACRAILDGLGYSVTLLRDGRRDGDYALLATAARVATASSSSAL